MTQTHILVVDHERAVLERLEKLLSKAGYHVTSCTDADTARSFRSNDVDLLVTSTPFSDPLEGVNLVAALREERRDLPVLVLGNDLNGLANSNGIESPSAFLIKPFEAQDVLDATEMLMGNSPGIMHNRMPSDEREIEARPTGYPTSDRHAMETAFTWEDETRSGSLRDQLAREKNETGM